MSVKLKGMTWSHPRGYDPMVATSAEWALKQNVEIEWSQRSLQDFESFPVEELARAYDLIVIDHPHVGQITAENCLVPLDGSGRDADLAELAQNSVGRSFSSYHSNGHQWAFPIDAATQVQAYRPDLLGRPAANWVELMELARAGRAIMPLRVPHSLMTFFTFTANLGQPCENDGPGVFVHRAVGITAIERLRELAENVAPKCLDLDPIEASEILSGDGGELAVMPFAYGYANYALENFRPHRLKFCGIPALGISSVTGTALGGTGIAVSAFSKHPQEAMDYAYWVASGPIQKTLFAQSGGQPGHAAAWDSTEVNQPVDDFYRDTRKTLDTAYVRPRHAGYMEFQNQASHLINNALSNKTGEYDDAGTLIDQLNALYLESF